MDPDFWHERWKNQDIGFHQPDFHALLQKYWPRLEIPAAAPVFVPLCGKSLDMVWLAQPRPSRHRGGAFRARHRRFLRRAGAHPDHASGRQFHREVGRRLRALVR